MSSRITLLLILLLAVALRLPGLGDSFYGDEGFSLLRDSKDFYTTSEDRFRPVFFSLLYLWRQLGFSGEVGLRLLPLLFGLLQIPLVFLIGRKLKDDKTGLILAGLLATSPILIEFSQELRMYSLAALLALAQSWFYLRIRENCSWSNWLLFILFGLLGVYTHLHYWLFLGGFALLGCVDRKTILLRRSWGALALIGLLYLPNYSNVINFMQQRGGEYAMHLPSALPKLLAAFAIGYNYLSLPELSAGRALDFSIVTKNLTLFLLIALPLLLLLIGFIRIHRRSENRAVLWLVHSLATFPIAVALLLAIATGKNWLQPKYLITSVPFALLITPLIYEEFRQRFVRIVFVATGALVLCISWLHFSNGKEYGRREDWRGAAAYLRSHLNDDSRLIITQGTWWLLDYYGSDLHQFWLGDNTTPENRQDIKECAARLSAALGSTSSVYYLRVDTFQNQADPDDRLPAALDLIGTRGETIQFNPRLKLLRWEINSLP